MTAADEAYTRLLAAQRDVTEEERIEMERARDRASQQRRMIRRLPKIY